MSPGSNDRNVNSNENDENKSDDDYPAFSVLNANTRSLGPKINSLIVALCYIPPNYTAARAYQCNKYVSDLIEEIKRTFEDCIIAVAGDFNQWPIERTNFEYLSNHSPDSRS